VLLWKKLWRNGESCCFKRQSRLIDSFDLQEWKGVLRFEVFFAVVHNVLHIGYRLIVVKLIIPHTSGMSFSWSVVKYFILKKYRKLYIYILCHVVFPGGLMVIVVAIGPKVGGFKPGRERWIFKVDKNP
jgi:hypothetical protein